MSLEEAILDKVRRLPPAKQEEVLRFADELQHRAAVRMVPSRDRSREMNWVCLLYDDGPTPRRIEPLLIFTDVEVPVGIEVAAQV